jgi:glycerol-3-phosphate acyltransferase PlsY
LTDSGSRPSDDHRDTDDLFVIRNGREPTHKDGDVIAIILLAPIAYLVGTFPSAVLIARARGVDITASGSGNPGASNVGRLLGRKLGVLVFVLDGLKGAVSVAIGYLVAGHAGALALACAAVVGHVFPITRGFKGGKGVATAGGSVIALYPIIGVAMTALWLITAKLTKKASLGSLAIAIGFPISQAIAGRPWGEIVTGAGLCAFVIWRHLPNLKRLVKGDELSLKKDAP